MQATLLEKKKEFGDAIEVLEEGLKQDDKSVELIFRLGVVFDKMGQKEKSIEQMRRVLGIDPKHADALNYIGYTYAEQGVRLNEAMELIQSALKMKPKSGYIIDSLGWVYYKKGLYDEAIQSLEKAFTLIPDDPTVSEHLGDVYFSTKKYKKSLEMYQKALSLNHPNEEMIKEKIEKVKAVLE
jgi:tetratricopeptide (TPR) repeat protein